MAHQYCCTQGEFFSDEQTVQALVGDHHDIRPLLYPGCGYVGEVRDTFDEADAVGLEHNSARSGHGGYVDHSSGFQYVCQVGDTLDPDSNQIRERLEHSHVQNARELILALFPGCGLLGPVTESFDEADAAGGVHNDDMPHHAGHVATV